MFNSISFNSNEIKSKKPITTHKQIGFRANDNKLERTSEEDLIELSGDKEDHTLRNIGIKAAVTTIALAILFDLVFVKGKHIRKLVKQSEKTAQKEIKSLEDDSFQVMKEEENIASRGSMGQDIYDPFEPANKFDPLSPFYDNTANKGMFGQDIYNPTDPMNKMDINSPFYDNGLKSSTGYGSGLSGDGFGSFGY